MLPLLSLPIFVGFTATSISFSTVKLEISIIESVLLYPSKKFSPPEFATYILLLIISIPSGSRPTLTVASISRETVSIRVTVSSNEVTYTFPSCAIS